MPVRLARISLAIVCSCAVSIAYAGSPKTHRLIEDGKFEKAYDRIERRIEKGRESNEADNLDQSTLHLASLYGVVPIIDLLLEDGVSIDVLDQMGRTPLAVAAAGGQLHGVRALLARGASVDLPNNSGITPLMFAVSTGYEPMVDLLLAAGSNPNAVDDYGADVLMHAASARRTSEYVQRQLIQSGAAVNTVDKQGLSAMFVALSRGNRYLIEQLRAQGVTREFADEQFENRQLQHAGYYFGVQMREANGRCEDPRFSTPGFLFLPSRVAFPAWGDAVDCIEAFKAGTVSCELAAACAARNADEAYVRQAFDRLDRYLGPSELSVADAEDDDRAVLFVDPGFASLQIRFNEQPYDRGRSTLLVPGRQEFSLGTGTPGVTVLTQAIAEAQVLGQFSLLPGDLYMAQSQPSIFPQIGIVPLTPLLITSQRSVINHPIELKVEPRKVYKAFASTQRNIVTGEPEYDIWVVDLESSDMVYESRGNPLALPAR